MAFTALFDACVLYPQFLRDVLITLAQTDLFRAKWTKQIHDEWQRNAIRDHPEHADRLRVTRERMDRSVPEPLVTGYEGLIPSLSLPDESDRHVLAAAIQGRADVIVTANLRHFPPAALAVYDIEPQHPDVFINHVLTLKPSQALAALRVMRSRLSKPAHTPEQFADMISNQGLPASAAFLRNNVGLI